MFTRVLLVGVLAAAFAMAQRGGGGGGMGGDEGGGRGGMGANIPTMRSVPSTLDRITGILKLDKDQKKSAKTILDDAQKEAAPLRDQMAKGRLEIAAAIQAGKSQADLDQAVNGYAALETKMTAIELKAFSKVFMELQSEQRKGAGQFFSIMPGLFQRKNWNEAQ